jgi:5'-nucleotidase / UDP-sugar diphosphatase
MYLFLQTRKFNVSSLLRGKILMRKRHILLSALLVLGLLLIQGCSHVQQADTGELYITIAHVNDTHSHLEASEYTLKTQGGPVRVQLGGMARLKSALDDLHSKNSMVLFLHGGDMVQGTLYFAKYQGRADMDILNLLQIDVASAGNHEFDEGPRMLASLIAMAHFPIISSNIDVSKEPLLEGRLAPYVIRTVGKERVAVIGLTTVDTVAISNPGPNVSFRDPVVSVMASVAELHKMNVRKLILLSHLGYDEDLALSKKISGVHVIVGANSHTLLGDMAAFSSLGLHPAGPYPTVVKDREGKDVLIVQAWEWAKVMGVLRVRFNADGYVTAWSGSPILLSGTTFRQDDRAVEPGSRTQKDIIRNLKSSGVIGLYEEDEVVRARLSVYSGPLKEMMKTVIARSEQDLVRGNNTGPGPIVVDSMLQKTRSAGVQIAIQNTGGIRKDMAAGDITVADVYELLPFNNTLVLIDLKGAELLAMLEEAVDFQIASGSRGPYLYVAGMSFRIEATAQKGMRIRDVKVRLKDNLYSTLESANTYRIVASNYLAGGGDGMHVLGKAAGYRSDTGFIDAEVLMEYLKGLGKVTAPEEKRISAARHYHDNRIVAVRLYSFFANNLHGEIPMAA